MNIPRSLDMLLPVTTEDLDLAPPDGAFWTVLRKLAVGLVVVSAIALIAGFLVAAAGGGA
jgi:hypothetical protein